MSLSNSKLLFCVALWLSPAHLCLGHEYRTIDGSNNNLARPDQGRANTPLVRIRDVVANPLPGFDYDALAPAYEDGIDVPRGMVDPNTPAGVRTWRLPNPRDLSNMVVAQGSQSLLNPRGASDWLWQWGQFIDHDIALEEPRPTSDAMLIPVSDPNDSLYNASFPFIPFRRNDPAPGTGAGTCTPREQIIPSLPISTGQMCTDRTRREPIFCAPGRTGC